MFTSRPMTKDCESHIEPYKSKEEGEPQLCLWYLEGEHQGKLYRRLDTEKKPSR